MRLKEIVANIDEKRLKRRKMCMFGKIKMVIKESVKRETYADLNNVSIGSYTPTLCVCVYLCYNQIKLCALEKRDETERNW